MSETDFSPYRITRMDLAEVQRAVQWAEREGWNPGVGDASAFFAADPSGFWAGHIDGQMVATISAVKYGSSFGFIGLYIVDAPQRGKGFGLRLWDAAMASLAGRNVGLDGVLAQQDNYRKSGFALAHRNIRFAGTAAALASADPAVTRVGPHDLDRIERYDRAFFPEERSAFLRHWTDPAHALTLVLEEFGQIQGYGCIRPCTVGFKIGPLNAETPDAAHRLFAALAGAVPQGSPVFLDVPEPNAAAIALAHHADMRAVFETARMYTRQAPPLPLHKIYGITSFELG